MGLSGNNTGIRCPNCHCGDNRVLETRSRDIKWRGRKLTHIRRRRQCRFCETTWYTVERNEEDIARETIQQIPPKTLLGGAITEVPVDPNVVPDNPYL